MSTTKMARNLWNLYALFLRGNKNTANSFTQNQSVSSGLPSSGHLFPSSINQNFANLRGSTTANPAPASGLLTLTKSNSSESYFAKNGDYDYSAFVNVGGGGSSKNRAKFKGGSENGGRGGGQKTKDKRSFVENEALPVGILLIGGAAAIHNFGNQQKDLDEVETKLWNRTSPEVCRDLFLIFDYLLALVLFVLVAIL